MWGFFHSRNSKSSNLFIVVNWSAFKYRIFTGDIDFDEGCINYTVLVKWLFIISMVICFLVVCVCVYALPPVGFFRLHDICEIREKFGSTVFCCEHFLGASAKFLHLYLRICLISPPKTKTPANRSLERKRYDIMFGIRRKDDIYWYRK